MKIEEQLRGAFGELGREVSPDPQAWARIERSLRSGTRLRRVGAVMGVVVIVTVSAIVGLRDGDDDARFYSPSAEVIFRTYRGDVWSFDYPTQWDVQRYYERSRSTYEVVWLSDGALGPDVERIGRDATRSGRLARPPFEPGMVLVELERVAGGPAPRPVDRPDTTMPLSLDDATVAGGALGEPLMELRPVVGGYQPYTITVWVGPNAQQLRPIVERVIASIRLASP